MANLSTQQECSSEQQQQQQQHQQQYDNKDNDESPQVTIILSDYENFGYVDRVSYHLDLLGVLFPGDGDGDGDGDGEGAHIHIASDKHFAYGVQGLLGYDVTLRSRKKQKRLLRRIQDFNIRQSNIHSAQEGLCGTPKSLPVPAIDARARLIFAYNQINMVICIGASPAMTFSTADILPLDHVGPVIRNYLMALVEPMSGAILDGVHTTWAPLISITVLSTLPPSSTSASSTAETLLLVRGFQIVDATSVHTLADHITEWISTDVESRIMASMKQCSLTLAHVLEASKAALMSLPPTGRPCIVYVTDGCSIHCPTILESLSSNNLRDIPFHLLDVSHHETSHSLYPLTVSNDRHALFNLCVVTGGFYMDRFILEEGTKTIAGLVTPNSIFISDPIFSRWKQKFQPNAIQWYTFFQLSLCSSYSQTNQPTPPPLLSHSSPSSSSSSLPIPRCLRQCNIPMEHDIMNRTIMDVVITTYSLANIRMKGLLLMRFKDGFIPRRWIHTPDQEKLLVLFSLRLEDELTILYEISAQRTTALVKLYLMGSPEWIQLIKMDYAAYSPTSRSNASSSIAHHHHHHHAHRISRFLHYLREDDNLRSYWDPSDRSESFLTRSPSFLRTLKNIDASFGYRHFQLETIHVLLRDDSDILGYRDFSSILIPSDESLIRSIHSWCSDVLIEKILYLKILTHTNSLDLSFCLLRLRSTASSRLITLEMLFNDDVRTRLRSKCKEDLKYALSANPSLIVPKPLNHLVTCSWNSSERGSISEQLLFYDSWSLPKDADLFYLVTKRRVAMEHFWVLNDCISLKHFGKHVVSYRGEEAGTYFVQYAILIKTDELLVKFWIEHKEAVFVHALVTDRNADKFCSLMSSTVRTHDLDCASFLASRKNVLRVFDFEFDDVTAQYKTMPTDLERLIECSTNTISFNLRFFYQSDISNRILSKRTENLLQPDLFQAPVKRLNVAGDVALRNYAQGLWFLVRHNLNILTLIHLSNEENVSADNIINRKVTFLTSYIYFHKHDQFSGAPSPFAPQIVDLITSSHNRNIAQAAYEALRLSRGKINFHPSDIQFLLGFLTERKVLNNFYFSAFSQNIGEKERTQTADSNQDSNYGTAGCQLAELLEEIMMPVPGTEALFFYIGNESDNFVEHIIQLELGCHEDQTSLSSYSQQLSSENEESLYSEIHMDSDDSSILADSEIELETKQFNEMKMLPPVFIRFSFGDGSSVSFDEIRQLGRRGCVLNAFVSIFSNTTQVAGVSLFDHDVITDLEQAQLRTSLPRLHSAVAIQIQTRLKSVVAEQTLERLHYYSDSICETEVKVIKKCFLESQSVLTQEIPVHFFSVKADGIVIAEASTPYMHDFEQGFALLANHLEKESDFRRFRNGVFICAKPNGAWCCVKVPSLVGAVEVNVFISSAPQWADMLVTDIIRIIKHCQYLVNQELLLISLHRSRNANDLLFLGKSSDEESTSCEVSSFDSCDFPFPARFFRCPIVFETSFVLNHRCPVAQVIMSLESTILSNFAIANRQGVFVYKDEDDRIFYLELTPKKNETSALTLLVHGIHSAGPAITTNLLRLIEKKILSMGVDALSTLLTKNTRFNLLPIDLNFLKSFQAMWREVEGDEDCLNVQQNEAIYQLPKACYDPGLLLMFFRHNISGSTFFHIRNDPPSDEKSDTKEQIDRIQPLFEADQGAAFYFQENNFSLYFNASPAQLDPSFQPVTTLTEAGMRFSRLCGTGVALIDVNLVKNSQQQSSHFVIGKRPIEEESSLIPDLDSLKLKRVIDVYSLEKESVGIIVRIINTTLDADILHRWIELSLTQALNGWMIERHIEKARLGLLINKNEGTSSVIDQKYKNVDKCCPGLPHLGCILHLTYQLPNPTVKRCDFYGHLKSTSLLGLTVNILEHCLLPALFNDRKMTMMDVKNIIILRVCRETCSSIQVRRDPIRESVTMYDSITEDRLFDHHDENPEYVCAFDLLPSHGQGKTPPTTSYLFQKVFIEDYLTASDYESGSLGHALTFLKGHNPSVFQRRITFILTVTRTARSALFYNWNPSVFQSAVGKIQDLHDQAVHSDKEIQSEQQQRCIRHIHFQKVAGPTKAADIVVNGNDVIREKSESSLGTTMSSGKLQRSSILKPTLVGKSVEGAAAQAVALSRAKASAKPITSSKVRANAANTANTSLIEQRLPSNRRENPLSLSAPKVSGDRVQVNHTKDPKKPQSHFQAATVKDLMDRIPFMVTQTASWLKVSSSFTIQTCSIATTLRILRGLYFSVLKDKTFRSVLCNMWDVISAHGILIDTKSFLLLKSSTCNLPHILEFLARSIASETEAQLISMRASESDPTCLLLFLRSISSVHVLVHELVVHHKELCYLRTFFFPSYVAGSNKDTQRQLNAVLKRSHNINVLKAIKLSAEPNHIINSYFGDLTPESSYSINYATGLLKAAANGVAPSCYEIPKVLTEMMQLLNESIQERPRGVHHSLLHRTVHYEPRGHMKNDRSYSLNELLLYICDHASLYNIQNCSSSADRCISTHVPPGQTIAGFAYLIPCRDTQRYFDLYVLCCVHGIDLNSYVRTGPTSWAQKLSDHLMEKSQVLIQSTLRKASKNLWRDDIWKKYTTSQSHSENSVGDFVSLRSLCHVFPVSEIDERFASILFGGDQKTMEIDWVQLETDMRSDAMFGNWTDIDTTWKLIYLDDGYLVLQQDPLLKIIGCEVLLKNRTDDPLHTLSLFGNFFLLWVYNNAEIT